MSRRWLWIAAALVLAGVAVALAIGVVTRPAPPAPEAVAPAGDATGTVKFLMEQQWAIRMKLAKATPATVARQITSTGRIVAAPGRQVVVAPPVSGVLIGSALPRVGQSVDHGQTLAAVRETPTATETAQIATGQAQVQIEAARLESDRRRLGEAVKEAEIRRDLSRREFERAQRLYEAKAYAQRQVEAAEADYRAAEAVLAAAVAQRDAMTSARIPAPPDSGGTRALPAPIAGTVVRVTRALGEQVSAGEALFELLDAAVVWVEVPVFERDLRRLGKAPRAFFTIPAASDREFAGRLVDAGSVVNRDTRAATLLFEVPNPDRLLRVGSQANVRLDADERVNVLMVPREAVLEAEGKRFVYVLVSGEEFQRREVVVGNEYGDQIAILEGLKAGERIVTQGAYQLRQHELRPSSPGAHTHET